MAETTTRPKTFTPALENGVAYRLQHSLVELIDLDLQARQAHWNVVGPNVRSLRDQFDEISVLARLQADALAERLAALQVSPDGTHHPLRKDDMCSYAPGRGPVLGYHRQAGFDWLAPLDKETRNHETKP